MQINWMGLLACQFIVWQKNNKMHYMSDSLYKLYSDSTLTERFYARLRWRLCPFYEIERLIPGKANILDIGCGFGLLSNYMALMSEDRKVLGIDLSEKRIAAAKKTIGRRANIDFIIADVKNLDIANCDAVVITDFLHHISFKEQERLLENIYSRLKNGGRLILQDVDASRPCRYFFTRALDRALNVGKPLYYRSKKDWQKLLQGVGFNVEVSSIDIFFLPDVLFTCNKK